MIYTVYNGKCQLFKIHEKLKKKVYVEFHVPKNQSYNVLSLSDGYEMFMINQQWLFNTPNSISIASDLLIDIKRYVQTCTDMYRHVQTCADM